MLKDWSAAHIPWGLSTEMTMYIRENIHMEDKALVD